MYSSFGSGLVKASLLKETTIGSCAVSPIRNAARSIGPGSICYTPGLARHYIELSVKFPVVPLFRIA
jgi:hypothetical protein